ncbi:unnamed protein product [Angiostrongylus costaricensis]|uniref:Anaphase-promoting complex subunit 13 n=1 Tax=Angiostrongylus costaricensis TaxID=334426 RepID=A0A0R3Q2N8_ANGCS|nr:unnamed protein product [Angiostrongylus costaricensis]
MALPIIERTTLRLRTFGSEEAREKPSNKVSLKAWDADGHPFSMHLFTHDKLVKPLVIPTVPKKDVDFIRQRNLPVYLSKNELKVKPTILLGSDQLWSLVRNDQRHVTLPSGLHLLPTRLGHLITGSASNPSQSAREPANGKTNTGRTLNVKKGKRNPVKFARIEEHINSETLMHSERIPIHETNKEKKGKKRNEENLEQTTGHQDVIHSQTDCSSLETQLSEISVLDDNWEMFCALEAAGAEEYTNFESNDTSTFNALMQENISKHLNSFEIMKPGGAPHSESLANRILAEDTSTEATSAYVVADMEWQSCTPKATLTSLNNGPGFPQRLRKKPPWRDKRSTTMSFDRHEFSEAKG